MASFIALDPEFKARVQGSFDRQTMMQTLHARLTRVMPGMVEIQLPFHQGLAQQHGFLHAGAIASIADDACGYAALSLTRPRTAVLTIEYKINLLAPAVGQHFFARGHVTRSGKTITVCEGEVWARSRGIHQKLIAKMISTIMLIRDRDDLQD